MPPTSRAAPATDAAQSLAAAKPLDCAHATAVGTPMSAQGIRLPDVYGFGELRVSRFATGQVAFRVAQDVDAADEECAELVISDEDALRLAATLLDAIGGVR